MKSAHTIANLEPGDHLCCLYETEEEHRAVLTPFLRQGLERDEKVLYILDAHTAEDILEYFRDDGLDVEPYLSRGQLAILTPDDTYMREGVFDPEGMIELLRAETEQAVADGYQAMRVTGETTWALRGLPGSERLIEYEARLNEFFPGSKCLAICQYDRRRFDPTVLLDVLRTHPIAVIGTELFDNFYYIPPAQFLGDDLPAVNLRHQMQNLAERKRAQEELRRYHDHLEELVAQLSAELELETLKKMVRAVITTRPDEIGCDECFEQMDRFAEMALAGKEIPEAMPLVQDHLERCDDCREEFEALLAALRALT